MTCNLPHGFDLLGRNLDVLDPLTPAISSKDLSVLVHTMHLHHVQGGGGGGRWKKVLLFEKPCPGLYNNHEDPRILFLTNLVSLPNFNGSFSDNVVNVR